MGQWSFWLSKTRGDSTFKNWAVYILLILLLSQFSKIVWLYNSDCAFICLHYYIGTLCFKKLNMDVIIYVQNFFLYFEYDGFLTLFKIIVVFFTYVMQVCEFLFFSSYFLFSFYLYVILYVIWCMYISIFE